MEEQMSPRLMPRAAQYCITPQVMVVIRRAFWGTVFLLAYFVGCFLGACHEQKEDVAAA